MANAHPIKDEAGVPGTGAGIVSLGTFPARRATVTSEVLARLLAGEKLTSLEAVRGASTTRLSAVTFYLAHRYDWGSIQACEKVSGCTDGRIAFVAEYSLDQPTIAAANAAGAAAWCASVHSARAALRTKAPEAYRYAQRLNRTRSRVSVTQPGQRNLFEAEGLS